MKINSVPVIDIRKLDDPHTLAELDSACREWGFFQVINHGIPREVTGKMFNQANAFFTQPIELPDYVVNADLLDAGFAECG